jgi:hypothetical protein
MNSGIRQSRQKFAQSGSLVDVVSVYCQVILNIGVGVLTAEFTLEV